MFKASWKKRCCGYLSNSHFTEVRREEEKTYETDKLSHAHPTPLPPPHRRLRENSTVVTGTLMRRTDHNRHTVHLISKATMSGHTCKVGDKALVCGSEALQQGHLSTHITPALMRQIKVSSTPLQSGMPSASPRDRQMSWLQRATGLEKVLTGAIPGSVPCWRRKVRKNILDI